MADEITSLKERVEALEKKVEELRNATKTANGNWLEHSQWPVSDPEALAEANRLGREFRKTGKLPEGDPS
jgi:hypothetical protein